MSIQIYWQSEISGPQITQHVCLLGVDLILTTVSDVIIDSAWHIHGDGQHSQTALADQVRAYLLNPNDQPLTVALYQQGSAYSQKVWQSLLKIPFGQVLTYSALASQLNSGPRAVAQACRNNPYAGIIPCHRVVAKSGLGGFMGQSQGLMVQLKQHLLSYERMAAESQP